jgi:hypothetical protein
MTDDWDLPTGEYERPRPESAEAKPSASRRTIGSDEPLTSGEWRVVDAFFNELAIEAAEDPRPPTADEQLAIDDLCARAERLKTMSPDELEAERARLRRIG